jgi:MFS family permease
MTGIYLLVVVLGTYLAPIASGYIAVSQGWRWVFWHCTIYMSATCVVMTFFLEETKWEDPVLNGSSVPQQATANPQVGGKLSTEKVDALSTITSGASQPAEGVNSSIPLRTYRQRHPWYTPSMHTSTSTLKRFFQQLYQPFVILGIFPAVMFSALQYAWSESMLSFLAVTQANLYPLPPYNFSAIGVGNMNIPPAIGAILGSLFGGPLSDYLIMVIARRRDGIYEPEYRLWTFMIPGASMVAGVWLYGLTIAQGMPWIINAVGAGLVGFALGGCGDTALTYVQDSYDGIIGPALIGIVFVRNGMATMMTFIIPVWQSQMGVYNMFLLLGVLAAVIMLTCVPLMIWGRRWRMKLGDRYMALARSCT